MGIVIMVVWSTCFVRVNRAYPQAEVTRAELDEPLEYGQYTVTVKKACMEETAALYEENGLSTADRTLPEAEPCDTLCRHTTPSTRCCATATADAGGA